MMGDIRIDTAGQQDLAALHGVIERAYRGDTARQGWTHEADLLFDERTELQTLIDIVAAPDTMLLIAKTESEPVGCVQITDRGNGLCDLGLLCIEPGLQAAGLGRQMIAAAESAAIQNFGSKSMEMTVIEQRRELIDYYQRRGYHLTGERRPFPIDLVPPLKMVVLAKTID